MKITVGQLKQIIKEEVDSRQMHPLAKGLQVKLVGKQREEDPNDEYYGELIGKTYAVLDQKGSKVGEIRTNEFFGTTYGELFGRSLPSLEQYRGPGREFGSGHSGPLMNLHKFAKSKTGWKWFEVTAKQRAKEKFDKRMQMGGSGSFSL